MTETNDINRLELLEQQYKTQDEKINSVKNRVDTMESKMNNNFTELNTKLDNIKESQHQHDLSNINVENSIHNINDYIQSEKTKKDESKKDMKQIKYIAVGAGFTFVSSLIIAILQIIF